MGEQRSGAAATISPAAAACLLLNIGKAYSGDFAPATVFSTCLQDSLELWGDLTAQHVGNMSYGLMGFRGSDAGTKVLVSALAAKIADSGGVVLNAQEIGMAVYGLQNLDGSDASTQALVSALATKIDSSPQVALNAQHIGNAVYGLQDLDGSDASTHALVTALAAKITGSEIFSWSCISEGIVAVSGDDEDRWLAHAELIASVHKNPGLFPGPPSM